MKKKPILLGEHPLYSVLSFILGFLFWPVAFVLGLIALDEIKKHPQIGEGSKYLAWAGILIQPVIVAVGLLGFAAIWSRAVF